MTANELIDIVDFNNNVVGAISEGESYAKRLPHRIVHCILFNDNAEAFLQVRSETKAWLPGHWSTSAGGHVLHLENVETAMERELKQELGVSVPLHKVYEFKYLPEYHLRFITLFVGKSNGPFQYNREVSGGQFFPLEKLKELVDKNEKVDPQLAACVAWLLSNDSWKSTLR